MTNIRELFAGNLKKYRCASGLTQAKLAEKASTSTYYVGMLELKRKFPSPEMMERLASAMGIDPSEFFLREATQDDVIRSYKIGALEDVRWNINHFFDKRLRELDG